MAVQALRTMTHGLDTWLWRRGISHPVIRPLVRNELLLTALSLLGGGIAFAATPWFFWFGVGLGIMALTFWSLARFFLRAGLGEYSTTFLRVVLLRWGGRLLLLAGLLYLALVVWKAPVTAILGGLTAGTVTALLTFAVVSRKGRDASDRG
ncbi:hypothetical protein [uncultured Desulfovibrio sp.]|uniref:hypothetical protein n=1 Tax=uncultured Desulfovibrio sp. TaxID=167968 RepID=UPI0003A80DB5|nr:hypothetical protein [uncultured Desulfovibrio sp.]